MGIEALSPEPPGGQGIHMLPEQERWNEKLCLEWVHWNMTPSAQDFFISFSFVVSDRRVLGQIPDTREEKKLSEIKILEEQFTWK